MRYPNTAIREHHVMPKADDVIYAINDAKVFTKLDLRSGYHQLLLARESRFITFGTHVGPFRFKRINFGVSSASEVFQEAIRQVLVGLYIMSLTLVMTF